MIRNSLIVVAMGLMAEGACALSLGAAQGQVWLGKPIDLGFEVQLDEGMMVDAACPQARLVSGDQVVPAGRVQVNLLAGEAGRQTMLRVRSSHLADEPVLSAQVSIGCVGRVMREYTFLADLPASVAAGSRPVAIPWDVPSVETGAAAARKTAVVELVDSAQVAPPLRKALSGERVVRKVVKKPAAPVAARASTAEVSRSVDVPPPKPDASAALQKPGIRAEVESKTSDPTPGKPQAAAASSAVAGAASAAASPTKPRLVMEPLAALVTPPASGDQPASESAGAGLGVAPTALGVGASSSGEGARVQALQAELERMRAQADQDRQATLALLARLERLDTGYFPAMLVYGLLALLALAMSGAAWVVVRMRRVMDASNEEWRNTLSAYVAQSSLPVLDDASPVRRPVASAGSGRSGKVAPLRGAGAVQA